MQLRTEYFTLLGFILYLQNALCSRTCGSELDNIQSRAYLAGIVFEGIAEKESPISPDTGRRNVTFKVGKIFKGKIGLPAASKETAKYSATILVGDFVDSKNSKCLPFVEKGKKYIVFLNGTTASARDAGSGEAEGKAPSFYRLSAEPTPFSSKNAKRVRSVLCKGCAKAPKVRPLSAPEEVEQGRRLVIKCRVTGQPPPVIVWAKDGQILSRSKQLFIKQNRKGSRLRIKKAKPEDAGSYECQASNVIGWHKQEINISVTGAHYTRCGEELKYYCMNGGSCYYSTALKTKFCHCLPHYGGTRCEVIIIPGIREIPITEVDERSSDRSITIAALAIGVLVLVIICIAAYFMARNKRAEFCKRQARRQQGYHANVKYQLNVGDEKTTPVLTRHTMTQTRDDNDSASLTAVIDQRPNQQLSDFLPAIYHPTALPGAPQQHGDPARRPRLQAVSSSRAPPYVGHSALVNAIVESEQEKSPTSKLPSPIGNRFSPSPHSDKDTSGESPSSQISYHGDDQVNHFCDNQKDGRLSDNHCDNMVNNNVANLNETPDYHSVDVNGDTHSESGDSEDSSSNSEGDLEQALLKPPRSQEGHMTPSDDSLLHPTDQESVGNLSWDEYGNALPSYEPDGYAFNPYTLDDDIIGNSFLSSPGHNGAQVALLDRLQNVKENQDPTAV